MLRVAVWGVAAGIVGARLYHVVTSWNEVPHEWWGPFAVWKGGLGVWGGILCGTLAGAYVVERAGRASSCSWTRSRRGSCSRRESAAGATTGTRSCSASRPTCRGPSRSTRPIGPRGTSSTGRSSRPSCTSSSGTCSSSGVLILDRLALPHQAARALRSLRRCSTPVPRVRGDAADRPRARLPRPAAQLLGLGRPLRGSRPLSSSGGSSSARARTRSAGPGRSSRLARRWRFPAAASGAAVRFRGMSVRELELDLEAFEGPFDLLLTLVLKEEVAAGGRRRRGHRARLRRGAGRAGAARPGGVRRVPRPRLVLARAEGAGARSRARTSISRSSIRRRRPRSSPAGWRSTGASRRPRTGSPSGWPSSATATSGSGRRRSRRSLSHDGRRRSRSCSQRRCAPSRSSRRQVSVAHMALRFPPVSIFLERFRALLGRRRRFDFEQEVVGLTSRRTGGCLPRGARAAEARAKWRSRRLRRSHPFECPVTGEEKQACVKGGRPLRSA